MLLNAQIENNSVWNPNSWKKFPALQQPTYAQPKLTTQVLTELSTRPQLVTEDEILTTQYAFSEAAQGRAFILQAGDCAEAFAEDEERIVTQKVNLLFSLSALLTQKFNKRVFPIGRIAGQYAKPRSFEDERRASVSLPCYRGDIINGFPFDKEERAHNPIRMLQAHTHAQSTQTWIRAECQKKGGEYFSSHEALLLEYEAALTHKSLHTGRYYNFSAHTLWLGERTKSPFGAHVEYLRGIGNPIGIKIGPTTHAEEILELLSILNPRNELGRVMLITRLGSPNVEKTLPKLIRAVLKSKRMVTWSVDPMHGNTQKTNFGLKTRYLDDIAQELAHTVHIHAQEGSILSGIHLEITPFAVTECLASRSEQQEHTLVQNYQSLCDPRLNAEQSQALLSQFLI